MIYREYGNTGEKVSILGFGGMRFENPSDIDGSAEILLHALNSGINYFDTAPNYCGDHSEDIFGAAVKEMKKLDKPFYLSTKSNKADGGDVRRDLENSLSRLNVDKIDFYNCWYVLTMEDWEGRKKGGAVAAILKAVEEGLIKYPVFSTHLPGSDIRKVIEEGHFRGVTLGYSAINFPFREDGIIAAAENKMGVVVMNPLGGGTITQNPDSFDFIRVRQSQNILDGALHFLMNNKDISVMLTGFRNKNDIDTAVASVDSFKPYTNNEVNKIKNHIESDFNNLCTTCMYCNVCPVDIPVWKFVETANGLYCDADGSLSDRLKYHWGTDIGILDSCTECRLCEDACTQHLPILERFEELKAAIGDQ
ncbi:MAG: aldo/keto reductase [Spirochaetota bacterium]|nr:aldo/keto reductase [Spirochaetota bacterium]